MAGRVDVSEQGIYVRTEAGTGEASFRHALSAVQSVATGKAAAVYAEGHSTAEAAVLVRGKGQLLRVERWDGTKWVASASLSSTGVLDVEALTVEGASLDPDVKVDVAGDTMTGPLVVAGTGKRLRLSAAGDDANLDASGADLILSVFANDEFGGAQLTYLRFEHAAQILHIAGQVQFCTDVDGSARHTVDASGGVFYVGSKNSLSNIPLAGWLGVAGPPGSGTWAVGDVIIDSNGTWWQCTGAGTPGTWHTSRTLPVNIGVAVSDETTALTTGTAKTTFRWPHAFTLTEVRASLSTTSSSGNPAIDVNQGGASIFSTTLTIDATEKTSTTAATAAVLGTTAMTDDAEVTIDIDTAGTGAKGLKLWFIGTRTA